MSTTETNLTHFDASGNAVMVDVSEKAVTFREAVAHGIITMNAEAFAAVESGTVKKGDVLGVARIAGIMATKRTSELIPLCHPLPLTKVSVDFRLLPQRRAVEALCTVKTAGVTGVEMEALTGVSTALLTIYDMCKAVDKGMELGERPLCPGGGRLCLILPAAISTISASPSPTCATCGAATVCRTAWRSWNGRPC